MATLNIAGRKVKVDDAFLSMPPEQQQAAVEEIARQVGPEAMPDEQFDSFRARASERSKRLTGGPGPLPKEGVDLATATAATLNGLIEGIPVAGPIIQGASDAIVGGASALTGGDYTETVEGLQNRRAEIAERAPIANIAGQVAGSIGAVGGLSTIPAAANALGLTGTLGARVGNSLVSGGAVSGADSLVRGNSLTDAGGTAAVGAGLSGAIPVVGAGVRAGVNALARKAQPVVGAALDPQAEALRRSGVAFERDAAANPTGGWGASEEAAARSAQIPVVNADRGGETVRALTRSVANQSPEARATIANTADDRFAGQAPRAVSVVRRLAGGNVDDVQFQQGLKDAAQRANRPAYEAAYSSPKAAAVWNGDIAELMQSPTFRSAVDSAEKRGADRAAVAGFKAVRNPFEYRPDGTITLKTNPDGSRALPTLQFWDQVKRNVDGMIGTAQRLGDNSLVADLTAIKQKLTMTLDQAVPEYQKARAGAALFFGAEDALEAGKKFGANMRAIPEAKAAFAKFSDPEKVAFRTGYASTLVDRIKSAGDRTNVINQVFKSPASREMIELAFGPAKARELEAYVRAETLADMLRGAMGNSTTARQLVELGIGAGGGFALTGDWKGALAGAAVSRGTRAVSQRLDNRVMQAVARLLTSDDPQAIQKAIREATKRPEYMKAMDDLGQLLAAPAKGAALTTASE